MKSVLLIGLGRFGRHMAAKLQELHHEVLAVDKNEERVNDALDLVTHAQIGDSTSEAFIASLGVRNFDLCGTLTCAWWLLVTTSRALWRPRPC